MVGSFMKTDKISDYMKQDRINRRKWNKRMIHAFWIALCALFVLGLLLPLRPAESSLEKRKLSTFPKPTLASLWDGSFFSGVETWYADTYPFREQFLRAEAGLENLYGLKGEEIYGVAGKTGDAIPTPSGKTPAPTARPSGTPEETAPSVSGNSNDVPPSQDPADNAGNETGQDGAIHDIPEAAGTVYVAQNRAFEIYYFSREAADAYASMLNTVQAKVGGSAHVYDILAPTSFGICLSEEVQESLGGSKEQDAFAYINGMLDPAITTVPVFDELLKHNSEYLYFNTDHHWTALGAYYAYCQFAQAKGIEPHALTSFSEQVNPGFLGSFYSYSNQSEALRNNPDTVYTYLPAGTNDCTVTRRDGKTVLWNVVSDGSIYEENSKYSCFIGGDNPWTEIHNPNITDGSSCVIVKDSYGNSFVPYLVDHYQNIYVVDYRHYTGDLTSFILENHIGDVLFLNNAQGLIESHVAQMLSLF